MLKTDCMPTHGKFKDLTNLEYDRLTVISYHGKRGRRHYWNCRCSCGVVKPINGESLRGHLTRSCGCLRVETAIAAGTTHGMTKTRTFKIWAGMRQRCENENNQDYHNYGGRGIKVCKRWQLFELFFLDMGEAPAGFTIERKNNNKGYCKNNCCWLPHEKQSRNRRGVVMLTFQGKTQCMAEWARELGLDDKLIQRRVRRGWPTADVLMLPKHPKLRGGLPAIERRQLKRHKHDN